MTNIHWLGFRDICPASRRIFAAGAGLLAMVCGASAQITFQKGDGQMAILLDGQPLATYVWNDPVTTRPYFKQVHAPGGWQVTRHHPPQPGDFSDHETYHPGLWWGVGDVDQNDYWRLKARIVGGRFVEGPEEGQDRGAFAVRDRLLDEDGQETFCEQLCRFTFLRRPQGLLMICESVFERGEDDFWLGDQEEMGLAVRVATPLTMKAGQGGRILNSEGRTNLKDIRTRPSDWCDYSGPLQGQYAGVMIMNDPENFRRPWWHAVDTGLLVANPLGESELNGRGQRKENVRVKKGEPFRLRYGVLLYAHPREAALDRAGAYQDFLRQLESLRPKAQRSELPQVPAGFEISLFVQEPMIYKPTSVCFDAQGRLFLGQGPQYPRNYEDSPTDSVLLLFDTDDDGVADQAKTFAQGFNSIQGLAWKGRDLYVANAPELTVVRDLNGDDEADEYVVVYTDLGNREHALHGLNWGPDGKLYMSKGNSKGHNQPEKYGYVAPRPFRELWDVVHPPGAPDSYPAQSFTKDNYRKTYHHWDDDWGREGGVLRCDPMGANLEIVARGMRNPWDLTLDDAFNWLCTDNDQNQGDRIMMPFFGAHFGWGHSYSSHWTGENHLPTAPVSGPVFPGSGTGIIFYAHPHFPAEYQNLFFINDWLNGTYVYRPSWQGALMMPAGGRWELFAQRGRGKMLYRPTDLEFAPDGTLYICGWGGDYHYEPGTDGSWMFRVIHTGHRPAKRSEWFSAKRTRPYAQWSFQELIDDLGPAVLPVWRVNAQDELVRRGVGIKDQLIQEIRSGRLNRGQETWALWALGRLDPQDESIDRLVRSLVKPQRGLALNLRLQALRILAHRIRDHAPDRPLPEAAAVLGDPEPRIRLEAVEAIWQARQTQLVPALLDWLAEEQDRLVFYAGWGALRDLTDLSFRKQLLGDRRAGVRLAALLGLLERHDLSLDEVLQLAERDADPRIQEWAATWALNPLPPKKMPNTTSRIELEDSVPMGDLLRRAREAQSPKMRQLYLAMISRATYRKDRDWEELRSFYGQLTSDEERALALPPLAREAKALPVLWDALAGAEPLRRAAMDGLIRLATRAESSPTQVADFLLLQASQNPKETRVPLAMEALARLTFSAPWRPPLGWDATLAAVFEGHPNVPHAARVLAVVSAIDETLAKESGPICSLLERASRTPDPRLFTRLLALNTRLGIEVEMKRPEPATFSEALALVGKAGAGRGRELFFSQTGAAGCFSCHRIQGQGQDYAPDLSGIGLRADVKTILQSILEPSAAITEGYRLQEIETDAFALSGAVLQETDSEIQLVRQDGQLERIPVRSVIRRQTSELSAMPGNYAELLSNEQVADLAAFLLTCRHPSGETAQSE